MMLALSSKDNVALFLYPGIESVFNHYPLSFKHIEELSFKKVTFSAFLDTSPIAKQFQLVQAAVRDLNPEPS